MTVRDKPFRLTVERILTLTNRPGVDLAGTIEAGTVKIGDTLRLTRDRQSLCDFQVEAIEYLDIRISQSDPLTLVALRVSAVVSDTVRVGDQLTALE